jgi:hypothetical protein
MSLHAFRELERSSAYAAQCRHGLAPVDAALPRAPARGATDPQPPAPAARRRRRLRLTFRSSD